MPQTRRSLLKTAACTALAGVAGGVASAAAAEEPKPDPKKSTVVVLDTSKGEIQIELNAEKAPITVKNFVDYVKKGQYDGTIFHRVIPEFMIQGGGMLADMTEKKTGEPIKNEGMNKLKNDRGTIAMARTQDPDSATAQFFINVKNNDGLNFPNPDGHGYAVFGKVIKGMDVVDKIVAVETTERKGHQDVPKEPITIKTAKLK